MIILLFVMRLKPAYKIFTWLTIALFAPLAILSSGRLVLCVGEDNHMQVESTGDVCCDFGVSDSGATELMGDISEHPGCGDCSDVDLDHVSSVRVVSRSVNLPEATVFAGMVWSVAAIPSANCVGKQALRDDYTPALTQPQLSISTAVLIC